MVGPSRRCGVGPASDARYLIGTPSGSNAPRLEQGPRRGRMSSGRESDSPGIQPGTLPDATTIGRTPSLGRARCRRIFPARPAGGESTVSAGCISFDRPFLVHAENFVSRPGHARIVVPRPEGLQCSSAKIYGFYTMSFSRRILIGMISGIVVGVFLGEVVAPLRIVADGFVKLLQMTVLPYLIISIISSLGSLTYADARRLGLRVGGVIAGLWVLALVFALLMPLAFPPTQHLGRRAVVVSAERRSGRCPGTSRRGRPPEPRCWQAN